MDFDGITGLESEITFNGLTLNEQRSSAPDGVRYKITDIGGLDDADVRDAREVNPARDGELALPAYYGGRTITLTGRIMARNVRELREMQQRLRTAFGALNESELSFSNGSTPVYIRARKSAPLQMREAQESQQPYRDFLLTLRASDPRFYSSATNSLTAAGTGLATTFTVVNPGNAASDPIIRITGPLYPVNPAEVVNAGIINLDSGQVLGLSFPATALLTASSFAEINCETRSITGSINYSNVAYGSVFPQVIAATNTFYVTGLTGTGNVSVLYQSAWM